MDKERIDPIIAQRDDLISPTPVDSSGEGPTVKISNNSSTQSSAGSELWKTLALVAFFASIAIALFGWQQYQNFIDLQQRFETLNSRLNSTDQSVTQSGAAMQVSISKQGDELKKHWSEIKKLWGVANDTNKGKIANNSKDIAFLASKRVALEASIAGLQTELEKGEGALADVSGDYLELSAEIDTLRQSIGNYASALEKLKASQARLQRQVNSNAEAIKSIDGFRRQINQKILKLEQSGAQQPPSQPEPQTLVE